MRPWLFSRWTVVLTGALSRHKTQHQRNVGTSVVEAQRLRSTPPQRANRPLNISACLAAWAVLAGALSLPSCGAGDRQAILKSDAATFASAAASTASTSLTAPLPATQIQREPSPFYVVARDDRGLDSDIQLYPLENGLFFGNTFMLVEAIGDSLVDRTATLRDLFRGDPVLGYERLQGLAGTWPSAVYAVTLHTNREPPASQVAQWKDGRWKARANLSEVKAFTRLGVSDLVTVSHHDNLAVLTIPTSTVPAPPVLMSGKKRLLGRAWAVATLPDGRIFVAGENRDSDPGHENDSEVVVVWDPRTKSVVMTRMDCRGRSSPHVHIGGLATTNGGQVYAFGNQYASGGQNLHGVLAQLEGQAWKCVETPDTSLGVDSVSIEDDGTSWIVGSSHAGAALWTRVAAGLWREVPMPELDGHPFEPTGVYARGPDDIWLSGVVRFSKSDRGAVAHTRPAPTPLVFPYTDGTPQGAVAP